MDESIFSDSKNIQWSWMQNIAFRIICCYFIIYSFSTQFIFDFPTELLWNSFVPWFGNTILDIQNEIQTEDYGSGDRTFDYLSSLVYLIISIFITIFWTIIDRKRRNYSIQFEWLIAVIRYYLAFQMISYSIVKIFPIQFQYPTYARLIQPVGELSPIELMWLFMGYSRGYVLFTGLLEFISGIFLLYRKTSTLGAILTFLVMSNVLALNVFYHIPVKLFSAHLILMSLIVTIPDFRRIVKFFILNKPVHSALLNPYFKNKRLLFLKKLFKWPIITAVLFYSNYWIWEITDERANQLTEVPLHGFYTVNSYEVNGEPINSIENDSLTLDWLIINRDSIAYAGFLNGCKKQISVITDTTLKEIHMDLKGIGGNFTCRYSITPNNLINIKGVYNQDSIKLQLRVMHFDDFNLTKEKFSLIMD